MSSPYDRHRSHVSERTRLRRADHGCSEEQVRRMKKMRDEERMEFEDIAEWESTTALAVKLALANTRSPNPNSGKAVINTTPANLAQLRAKALPGETAGQAFERLLMEHGHFERLLRR